MQLSKFSRWNSLGTCLVSLFALAPSALAQDEAPADPDDSALKECAAAYEQTQVSRNEGALVEAQQHVLICVRDACPDFVKEECGQWLSEIKREVPSLILVVQDAKGNEINDATVLLDEAPFDGHLDGKSFELNPGRHMISVESNGQTLKKEITVRQAEKSRVEIIKFDAGKDSDDDGIPDSEDNCPQEAGIKSEKGCLPKTDAPPPSVDNPGGTLRTAAYASWGVGVLGLLTSGGFGIWKSIQEDDIVEKFTEECEADASLCDSRRIEDENSSVETKLVIVNMGLGVGITGALVGGVLYYLGYSEEQNAKAEQAAILNFVPHQDGGVFSISGRF